jgi:hypothetical protein
MKSKLKRVIVKCLDWVEEFDIDPNVFDDVYMEAATRALEKRKDGEKFLVTVVMETFLKTDTKKSQKHYVYNTYFVLINAGLHFKAEMMRLNFLKSHGVDLRKESLKGDDNGTEPNKSFNQTDPPTTSN